MIDGKASLDKQLTNIYDADVTNDYEVGFIVFSSQSRSIYWIKREVPSIAFKWSSNFWINIIMFIHISALLLGLLHFTLIMHSSAKFRNSTNS